MGKEFSMACSEDNTNRNQELLDGIRTGVYKDTSSGRNKRKEEITTIRKGKGRKIKDTKTKSKISTKAEDTNGGSARLTRHRYGGKDRKSDRGVKGKDKAIRRNTTKLAVKNAKELGIEWIGSYCPDGKPHVLIGTHDLYGGSLFKCNNCKKHVWLPIYIKDAAKLDSLIDYFGATAGYCKYLDSNRDAKMLVAKLQDLWNMRSESKMSNIEFARIVVRVMEDKEYDRKDGK